MAYSFFNFEVFVNDYFMFGGTDDLNKIFIFYVFYGPEFSSLGGGAFLLIL